MLRQSLHLSASDKNNCLTLSGSFVTQGPLATKIVCLNRPVATGIYILGRYDNHKYKVFCFSHHELWSS